MRMKEKLSSISKEFTRIESILPRNIYSLHTAIMKNGCLLFLNH